MFLSLQKGLFSHALIKITTVYIIFWLLQPLMPLNIHVINKVFTIHVTKKHH